VAWLARHVFDAGLTHTVLAVPLGHPDRRLDTICTMLNGGTVLMRPAAAYSLTARVLTPGAEGPRVSHPQAFLAAAAAAGLVVTHERNVATLARLERCGIESITVPGNELCGARGGPRSLCCPVSRDPVPLPAGLRTEL
jgi:arginine deiminase